MREINRGDDPESGLAAALQGQWPPCSRSGCWRILRDIRLTCRRQGQVWCATEVPAVSVEAPASAGAGADVGHGPVREGGRNPSRRSDSAPRHAAPVQAVARNHRAERDAVPRERCEVVMADIA